MLRWPAHTFVKIIDLTPILRADSFRCETDESRTKGGQYLVFPYAMNSFSSFGASGINAMPKLGCQNCFSKEGALGTNV